MPVQGRCRRSNQHLVRRRQQTLHQVGPTRSYGHHVSRQILAQETGDGGKAAAAARQARQGQARRSSAGVARLPDTYHKPFLSHSPVMTRIAEAERRHAAARAHERQRVTGSKTHTHTHRIQVAAHMLLTFSRLFFFKMGSRVFQSSTEKSNMSASSGARPGRQRGSRAHRDTQTARE